MEKEKSLKQAKAEALDNSVLFDVHKWSDYPEVNRLVDLLFERFQQGNARIKKQHFKVLVLDLYVNYCVDPTSYIAIYRMKGHYTKLESRYNKLNIKYESTVAVMDWLHEQSYIELTLGTFFVCHNGRRVTRIRATLKMMALLKKHKVEQHMVQQAPNAECIILKNESKKQVAYEDNEETIRMREQLTKYNNLLARTHVDIPELSKRQLTDVDEESDKSQVLIGGPDKFVKRVFNNSSFEQGGRFYGGWWQRISEEWRSRILINGVETTERDLANLHITLLYALEGRNYWQENGSDAYTLPGYQTSTKLRKVMKLVMLTLVNTTDRGSAIKAVRNELVKKGSYDWIKSKGYDIGALIDAFEEKHHFISMHFYTGVGLLLQRMDSEIAESVIKHFTDRGTPVLCIHDSFIIQANQAKHLVNTMNESYRCFIRRFQEKDMLPRTKSTGWEPGKWQEDYSSEEKYRELNQQRKDRLDQSPEYKLSLRQHQQRLESGEYTNERYYQEMD